MVELAVVAEELGRAAAPGPWGTTAVVVGRGGRVRAARARPRSCCPGWPTAPSRPRWSCPPAAPDGRPGGPGRADRHARRRTARWRSRARVGPVLNGAVVTAGAGAGGRRRRRCGGSCSSAGPAVTGRRRCPASTPPGARPPGRSTRRWCRPSGCSTGPPPTASGTWPWWWPRPRRPGGPLVPRHRRRARPHPPAVRPAHRPVPGGQAPAGRHAGRGGAGGGGHLGRRPGARRRGLGGTRPDVGRRRADQGRSGRAAGRRPGPRRLRRGGQGRHPGPRGHGVHLGARRPHPPAPGHHPPPAGRAARRPCGPRRPGWPWTGRRRTLAVDLPPEAEPLRAGAGARWWPPSPPSTTRPSSAGPWPTHGLLAPHWPAPWGRDAGAVEQLVIDQVCAEAGLRRPNLAVAAWALPTIIAHGTAEQTERWVAPDPPGRARLVPAVQRAGGRLRPGRAQHPGHPGRRRVVARPARRCGPRWPSGPTWASAWPAPTPTCPSTGASPTSWSTCASPGIEVRPLREITGDALFNEVFFDGCFVPDDCVVGEVDGGWRLARTTLANERVSLSSDSAFGGALEGVLARVAAAPRPPGPGDPGPAGPPAGRGPVPGPARACGPPCARWAGCNPGPSRACASCWAPSSSSGSTSSASTSAGPTGRSPTGRPRCRPTGCSRASA